MKKICLLLALSLLCSLAAGCAGQTEEPNTPLPDDENIETIDLSYFDCVLIQDRDVDVPLWYEADTALADEAIEKINAAAEKLGCSITLKMNCFSTGTTDNADAIIKSQASGEKRGDVFFGDSYVNYLLAASDNLIPLTDVKDQLDYENADKFGGANIQELTLINGVPYAVTPVQWPEMLPNMRDVLIVNEELAMSYFQQPDPRELLENQNWNRDTFESFIVDTTEVGADGNTSIYGLTGSRMYLTELSILNNDVDYLVRNEDGGYESELNSTNAVEALSWLMGLVNRNPGSFLLYNDSPSTVTDLFASKGATTLLMSSWWLFLYVVYDIESFAILPFPKMCDTPESGWISAYQSNLMASIPLNTDDADCAAVVIDELFNPFVNYPDRESIKAYYYESVFHDRRDVDVLYKMADYTSYNYNYVGGEDFFLTISDSFTSKTAAEHLAGVVSTLDDVIDTYIEPNYEYMASHS